MKAIDFKGSNIILGKPENMTDEQCNSIPEEKGVDNAGFPFFAVAFEPNDLDKQAINTGRPIFLKVLGTQFPTVAMFTLDKYGAVNDDDAAGTSLQKTGVQVIAEERAHQFEKGRTTKDDVLWNTDCQLGTAAGMLCYELIDELDGRDAPPTGWDLALWQRMWDKPYLERLAIAGALIAAEIDRMNTIQRDVANLE